MFCLLFLLIVLVNGHGDESRGHLVDGDCTEGGERCCKRNGTECVGRDPYRGCRFKTCVTGVKEEWEKENSNKTYFNNKFKEEVSTFHAVFANDTRYSGMTKDERKDLKKGVMREKRGGKIKFKTENKAYLSWDKGGWKQIGHFKNAKFDEIEFIMADDPEHEDDFVDIPVNSGVYFEDYAEFKVGNKTIYSGTTVRKTESEGFHKTTFKNKETNEECVVDGSREQTGCRIGRLKFDLFVAGSVGAMIGQVVCLPDTNAVTVARIGEEDKFLFNGEAYDGDVFLGVNTGTYTFTGIPADYTFGINGVSEHYPSVTLVSMTACTGHSSVNSMNVSYCSGGNATFVVSGDFFSTGYRSDMNGTMGGSDRLYYDTTCPSFAEAETETETEDDNTAAVVGGVIGGFFGVVLLSVVALNFVSPSRLPSFARFASAYHQVAVVEMDNF